MWETLTSTTIFGGGMSTAYPTVNGTLTSVEKKITKKNGSSVIKGNNTQSTIGAALSTTMVSASTMVYDDIHYQKTLNNAFACVEAMSDEELEQALIAIGELEGEMQIEDTTTKSI